MTPVRGKAPLVFLLLLCSAGRAGAGDATKDPSGARARKFGESLNQFVTLLHEASVAEPSAEDLFRWSIEEIARVQHRKVPAAYSDPRLRPSAVHFANAYLTLIEGESPDPDILLWQVGKGVLARIDHFGKVTHPDNVPRFIGSGEPHIGVGMSVERDKRTGLARVITPIKDGPAYKAGIRGGDLITTITPDFDAPNKDINVRDVISTKGLPDRLVDRLIRNVEGKRLRVTVDRPGAFFAGEFILKRSRVVEETVLGRQRRPGDGWDHWLDRTHRIGYVRITGFGRTTFKETRARLRGLLAEGMRGLVLDLRFNPGGLLDATMEIADLFVADGVILDIRQRGRRWKPFRAKGKGTLAAFPMVCLINGESASGAEILAACLQDHKRALILGQRSRGKGSVQNQVEVGKVMVKVSTATFVRPSGHKLDRSRVKGLSDNGWGVSPDKGQRVRLSAEERGRLKKHLDRIVYILPKPLPDTLRDRQRDHALTWLRRQLGVSSG